MTHQYHIIGLSRSEIQGNSYKTGDNGRIIHDENGRGISIQKPFPHYILYVVSSEDANYEYYYAIQLSQTDCGCLGGTLGHIGSIEIHSSTFAEANSNITHLPAKQMSIFEDFEELQKEDTQIIYTKEDPSSSLFSVSNCGGDEKTPNGWIHVNMELFYPIILKSRI
jgi:hypothetical protein